MVKLVVSVAVVVSFVVVDSVVKLVVVDSVVKFVVSAVLAHTVLGQNQFSSKKNHLSTKL